MVYIILWCVIGFIFSLICQIDQEAEIIDIEDLVHVVGMIFFGTIMALLPLIAFIVSIYEDKKYNKIGYFNFGKFKFWGGKNGER